MKQRAPAESPTLRITWPLYGGDAREPLPADPAQALNAYAPPSAELADLAERTDFIDSEEEDRARARRARGTLPPNAPEWMRAAHALSKALESLVKRGSADPVEQAAIARAWAAWALGGVSESHILRVAHLVSRAHRAIREAGITDANREKKYNAAAGVLHTALPSAIRDTIPVERARYVVHQLGRQTDPWAAVVEGTVELLGWKHYATIHAASVIRAVLERGRVNVIG